jgi:hypothetical protein
MLGVGTQLGGNLVDMCLGIGRAAQRPQQIAGAQVGEPGALGIGKVGRAQPGQHLLGLLATEQPGQRVCAQVGGLRSGAGLLGGGGQALGQGQVRQSDGAPGGRHQ